MGTINLTNTEASSQNKPTYTWATKPTATAFGVGQAWFSDIGALGYSDGISWSIPATDSDATIVVLGSDHTSIQHYGSNNNGLSRMYADLGLPHYLAINTDHPTGGNPGANVDQMTWNQIKTLRDVNGCEITSHAARHPSDWDKLSTGFNIRYVGAGSAATIAVTGTFPAIIVTSVVTGGPGSETFAFDTSNALYNTVAKLSAAIIATGTNAWTCVPAAEIPPDTPSNYIFKVAALDVKTAIQHFPIGGGIWLHYYGTSVDATDAKSAFVIITASSLILYQDGVKVGGWTLSGFTLTTLCTAINALGGWAAYITNDLAHPENSYLTGSESAANLSPTLGVVDCSATQMMMSGGIGLWQMIDWQMTRAKAVAAANGVDLKNFCQPGGAFRQYMINGHTQHEIYRGNTDYRLNVAPFAVPAKLVNNYFLSHQVFITYSKASVMAQLAALVASPGWFSCWLMHNLVPDGTTGYSLNYTGFSGDQVEADWFDTLKAIKGYVRSGTLRALSMSDGAKAAKLQRLPQNLIFNPSLINSGETMTGLSVDLGRVVPGWILNTPALVTAASISDGKLSITTDTATTTAILYQQVYVEPGKTYEFGCLVEVPTFTSGTGAIIEVVKTRGKWKGKRTSKRAAQVTNIAAGVQHVKMQITIPSRENPKTMLRSLATVGPTWDLSVNKNIKINVYAIGAIDVDCSVGAASAAATTAYEIAAAINAGIKAASAYRDYPEFHNIARAEAGRVIIELPVTDTSTVKNLTLAAATSASATAVIFGNNDCLLPAIQSQSAGVEDYVMWVRLSSEMVGTMIFSKPYFSEVKFQ